jgi:hypothetical protein
VVCVAQRIESRDERVLRDVLAEGPIARAVTTPP